MVMMRMLPVRAWCPRYRPTCSFGCIPVATALATTGRQQTDSPNSATSLFRARPERGISADFPFLPILKKLIAPAQTLVISKELSVCLAARFFQTVHRLLRCVLLCWEALNPIRIRSVPRLRSDMLQSGFVLFIENFMIHRQCITIFFR